MFGSGLSVCVILLVIWQLPIVVAGIYRCTILKDPHLYTFGGQNASLPIPCAFLVSIIRLNNSLQHPGFNFSEIEVEVGGGNSQQDVNGRYYACDAKVKITFNGTTGSLTKTYYTGEKLISSNTSWISSSNETMLGRVQHTYDPATNTATLTITNTTLKIQFVPVNRSQGNHQHNPPGITVEVGDEDLIPDNSVLFPETMCSTVSDTTSISVHRQLHGLDHRFMGLYAALWHMQYNIPYGDQDPRCANLMGKFQMCDAAYKKLAFTECFGLMRTPQVVRCFRTQFNNTPVTVATDTCLDYHCSESAADCLQLRDYSASCSQVGTIVNLTSCAP